MEKRKRLPLASGYAFAMVRTKLGYTTKEKLIFTITNDSKYNKQVIDEFAKEQNAAIIEVWSRDLNNWGEIKHYKTYNYIKCTIDENKLKELGW